MAITRAYRPRPPPPPVWRGGVTDSRGIAELRRKTGSNLPASLRWDREARSLSPPPRHRFRARSRSPSLPARNSLGVRLSREDDRLGLFTVQKDEILIDTLTWYNIPWEYEGEDSIILLQELNKWELDVLHQHTGELRDGTLKEWDLRDEYIPTQRLIDMNLLDASDLSDDSDDENCGMPSNDGALLEAPSSIETQEDNTGEARMPTIKRTAVITRLLEPTPLQVVLQPPNNKITTKEPKTKSLKLTTVPLLDVRAGSGLFFQLHIQQETVNYDAFLESVLAIPQLATVKDKILEHFTHAWSPILSKPWKGKKRRCRHKSAVEISEPKTTEDGKAHYIPGRPWYVANDSEAHYTRDDDFEMMSICVPFAHLGKLDRVGGSVDGSENDVPTHTLFQSLNRNGDKQHDMKQAACQTSKNNEQPIQLVSELWAAMINDALLITCSPLSHEELYGSILSESLATADSTNLNDSSADICVHTADGCSWLLKRSDCATYFDFVSHFSHLSQHFARRFIIHCNGVGIPPTGWADFIQEDNEQVIDIELLESEQHSLPPKSSSFSSLIKNTNLPRSDGKDDEALGPAEILLAIKEKFTNVKSRPTLDALPQGQEQQPTERVMSFEILDCDTDVVTVNEPLSTLHSDRIYQTCGEVDVASFDYQLQTALDSHLEAAKRAGGNNIGMPPKDVLDKLSQIFSAAYPSMPEADWSMTANLLDGLRALLQLFPQEYTGEMEGLHRKVLGATFNFITAFTSTLTLLPSPVALLMLQCCFEKNGMFRSLFERLRELGLYPFTFPTNLNDRPGKFAGCVRMFTKQLVVGLCVAASLVHGLSDLVSDNFIQQIQSQSAENTSKLARLVCRAADDLFYTNDELDRLEKITDETQNKHIEDLKQACRKLNSADFEGNTLVQILRNKLGWNRVRLHCDRAKGHLNRIFELECERHGTALPAPQPVDLLAALVQRVIHLPTFEGESAIYMYNRYMTELESNLLLSDDTTEANNRLRHLRHELNAISQLQHKQQIVLDGFTQCLDEFEDYRDSMIGTDRSYPPMPARTSINRTVEQLRMELNNINALEALIERLQGGGRLRVNAS